jgi:hypothetical protein
MMKTVTLKIERFDPEKDQRSYWYEGHSCLDLLRRWQEGETPEVVAFLQRKLDGLPFAEHTHQIREATTTGHAGGGLLQRLVHGRLVF